jgi:hypothetical protein
MFSWDNRVQSSDVMLWGLEGRYNFRRNCYLHFQGRRFSILPWGWRHLNIIYPEIQPLSIEFSQFCHFLPSRPSALFSVQMFSSAPCSQSKYSLEHPILSPNVLFSTLFSVQKFSSAPCSQSKYSLQHPVLSPNILFSTLFSVQIFSSAPYSHTLSWYSLPLWWQIKFQAYPNVI